MPKGTKNYQKVPRSTMVVPGSGGGAAAWSTCPPAPGTWRTRAPMSPASQTLDNVFIIRDCIYMSVLLTNPAAPPPPALCPSPPDVHTYCRPTASMMMSKTVYCKLYGNFELCKVELSPVYTAGRGPGEEAGWGRHTPPGGTGQHSDGCPALTGTRTWSRPLYHSIL